MEQLAQPARIAIIGAGPRGVGVLERLATNAAELDAGPLIIDVIDPHPPGGGKVWRFDQSPLLRLNSMAGDIGMFTDHTVACEGPIRPGPTMAEWARLVDPAELPTEALRAEARSLTPITFPTRRLGGEYLAWVYRAAIAAMPAGVQLNHHATSAVDLFDDGETQVVVLEDGSTVRADAIVLTLGHLDVAPSGEPAAFANHADRHGLAYLPPAYGTECDLSSFRAGEDIIVRGFGLGFVDLLVLLTEGRDGRFVDVGGGRLRYEPSGREPRFHVGSRRGVPYRAKITYDLVGPAPRLPRFFTSTAIREMLDAHDVIDFRDHAWPLIAKEVAWAAYHELAHGHPERLSMRWDEFDARLAATDWGTPEWDAIVHDAVPDDNDRVDFAALDRPLVGTRFADADELQRFMRGHIEADLARRSDRSFSADLGAFNAFLSIFANLPYILGSPKLSPTSRVEDFDDWWFGFFSYYASGPPPRRLEELLALSAAGIVSFLGGDMWVRLDDERGEFVAGSTNCPSTLSARALIDARLPGPSVQHSRSPLVRALADRGELSELILTERDGRRVSTGQIRVSMTDQRVVEANGSTHRRRFALGQHSMSRAPAFARPRTNAPSLRHNDVCARAVLELLRSDQLAATATGGG